MKTLILAGLTMVTVAGATAADAQRLGTMNGGYGASYPVPGQQGGMTIVPPAPPPVYAPNAGGGVSQSVARAQAYRKSGYAAQSYRQQSYPQQSQQAAPRTGGSRWGASNGGRWYGGTYAPGGWNAYRRPSRGYRMPSYWTSASFFIGDYANYGLSTPPSGYGWHRYYDDAVLLDPDGRVYDTVGGLNWDGGGYAQDGYAQGGYARGGAGGAGGYASSDYGYAEGGAGGSGGYGPAQPQPEYAPAYPSLPVPSRNGAVTTYQTGGYGGGATVITIQPSETITTTTTDYIEETTTRYAAPRRVYRAPKRHYRPVVRRKCSCQRAVAEQPILGS